ncbi:hypothetical protein BLNAU_9419 [Blattamonas nauphoetae]|uniref:Uncharacterized protein n=1 Tax=Blattamonas nauphoetae TaxID=2049346 RepID=A0ABQ9XVP9_9EUKA|nr:hypothetical protein BLNAU_9419 [Blattamonas nauphoetae]
MILMFLILHITWIVTGESNYPAFFDRRLTSKQCKSMHHQGYAGECQGTWAFAVASMMSDRLCYAGTNLLMSPEDLLQCDENNNGCSEGFLSNGLDYAKTKGVLPALCKSFRGSVTRLCSQTCDDGQAVTNSMRYTLANYFYLNTPTPTRNITKYTEDLINVIKQEIFLNGTVAASFKVTERFVKFMADERVNKMVYSPDFLSQRKYNTNDTLLHYSHGKIVGWGEVESTVLTYPEVIVEPEEPETPEEPDPETPEESTSNKHTLGSTQQKRKHAGSNKNDPETPPSPTIEERTVPYWIVQVYTQDLGVNGYILLEMNTTELQIEADVWGCTVEPPNDSCNKKDEVSLDRRCHDCTRRSTAEKNGRLLTNSSLGHQKAKEAQEVKGKYRFSSKSHKSENIQSSIQSNADTDCAYCLSTDNCISVNVHKYVDKWVVDAVHGICPELAFSPTAEENPTNVPLEGGIGVTKVISQCPLDDCLQFSASPHSCLNRTGCGYCASTQLCQKGGETGNNQAVPCPTLSWIHSKDVLETMFPCTMAQNKKQCLETITRTHPNGQRMCGWCETTQECIDTNWMQRTEKPVTEDEEEEEEEKNDDSDEPVVETVVLEQPLIGRCPSEFYSSNKDKPAKTPTSCSDLTTLTTCARSSSILPSKEVCEWTVTEATDMDVIEHGGQFCVSQGTSASNAKTLIDNQAIVTLDAMELKCNQLSCTSCKTQLDTSSDCIWCYSTQSCVAATTNSAGERVAKSAICSIPVANSSSLVCSECASLTGCTECVQKAGCVWITKNRLCRMSDEVTSKARNSEQSDDVVTAILQCPSVSTDSVGAFSVKTKMVSLLAFTLLLVSFC